MSKKIEISKRQAMVAALAGRGKSADYIAGELGVSVNTVKRDRQQLRANAADFVKVSQSVLLILMEQLKLAASEGKGRNCAEIAVAIRRFFPADPEGDSSKAVYWKLYEPESTRENPKD